MVRDHIDRVKEHTSRKRPGYVVSIVDERKYKVKKEHQDKWINDISAMNTECPNLIRRGSLLIMILQILWKGS